MRKSGVLEGVWARILPRNMMVTAERWLVEGASTYTS